MKSLVFMGALIVGYLLIRYGKWLRDSTGIEFLFVEKIFGPGGTLTFLKILGVALIAFGFYWLFH